MDSECPSCRYPLNHEFLRRSTDEVGDATTGDETSVLCPNCGKSLVSNDDQTVSLENQGLSKNQKFDRFELLRVLGQGGFGTVWLAKDSQLERQVALKIPARKHGYMSNLIGEAKTAAKLRHPNIVTIHEVGQYDRQVFIVSEYIDGMDLRSLLDKEALIESRIIELLRAIALGLHHAHEKSIVHRDMKPANILVDSSGVPLVADFGLAKKLDVEESISSKGKIVGTILYMAPEQAGEHPDQIDRRADIYALGVIMYEMLTGEKPFRGDVQAIFRQKTQGEVVPPRRLRPKTPLDLETICLKCLQASPSRRYSTALQVQEELDRYSQGLPIQARPASRFEHAWRWCLRNRAVASLLTMLFLSLSIGFGSSTFFWLKARLQTAKTQRSLYGSQMTLANGYFSNGDITATQQALDRFLEPDVQHLRGFEWYFLSKNLKQFRNTLKHGKQVTDIGMSRGGEWVVSISDDRALRVWDTKSGNQIREIPAKVGRWQALAVSRRDNDVAAGAKDGTVYVWDSIQEETNPPKILKHGRSVTTLKYSGDGKRLFSAADSGAIRVWDTTSNELVVEIPTGQEGVVDFDVSQDGSTIVVAGHEGVVRAWETDTRSMICMVQEEKHRIEAVAVSAKGDHFYIGSYGSYLIGYQIDGTQTFSRNTRYDWISDITFLGSSSVAAICSSKGSVVFFDVEKQQELGWLETHNGAGGSIAVSSTGKSLAVGSKTGEINILDISDYHQATVMRFDEHARDVRLFSDNSIIAAFSDGSVRQLDFEHQATRILSDPTAGRIVPAICILPDLSLCAVAHPIGSVDLFNGDGKLLGTIPERTASPTVLRLANKGSLLVVAEQSGLIVGYEIDRSRKNIAAEVFKVNTRSENQSEASIRDVCVSHDGDTIAVAMENAELRLLDVSDQRWQPDVLSFESTPVSLAFADEDLLVGTRDGFISRIDKDSLSSVWRTKAHAGHLNMICVIPHSESIASVGQDKYLHIWDLLNGDRRIRLLRHEHQVFAVDSSVDGRTLVTGGLEGEVRLWITKGAEDRR